jgi:hypothetical protein
MSVLLLLVAIVFVTLYALGQGLMPVPLQSFLTPPLLLSILYVLGFVPLALIDPRGPAMNSLAVLFLAVIAPYGGRRLRSRIGERRPPLNNLPDRHLIVIQPASKSPSDDSNGTYPRGPTCFDRSLKPRWRRPC